MQLWARIGGRGSAGESYGVPEHLQRVVALGEWLGGSFEDCGILLWRWSGAATLAEDSMPGWPGCLCGHWLGAGSPPAMARRSSLTGAGGPRRLIVSYPTGSAGPRKRGGWWWRPRMPKWLRIWSNAARRRSSGSGQPSTSQPASKRDRWPRVCVWMRGVGGVCVEGVNGWVGYVYRGRISEG